MLAAPAVVGVPEMVPPVLRDRPAGKVPDLTVHMYGARSASGREGGVVGDRRLSLL